MPADSTTSGTSATTQAASSAHTLLIQDCAVHMCLWTPNAYVTTSHMHQQPAAVRARLPRDICWLAEAIKPIMPATGNQGC